METFDVFLSHNSKDEARAHKLFLVLQERGLSPWLAAKHLAPGQRWQEALEERIADVPAVAVLVGRDGLGRWEDMEMQAFLEESVDRKIRVIPVLLRGAPRQSQLPPFLRLFNWVDLRGGLTEQGIKRLIWAVTGKWPAEGKILAPERRAQVTQAFTVKGSLSAIPPDCHVRIAVQSGGLFWPKDPELPAQKQTWELQIRESGPGRRFSLALLLVDPEGHKQISAWLERGQENGDYPGLKVVPGSKPLHEVRELVLK
ncbi:MAG TPA: toll/interleukin-1 receptor domain-containing protein [Thermoanaerobaculia bacterium]|nr:toll/interleukin-1 receptor domain-containing protein [Thermoanaerobaculia bacterium]